MRFTRQRAGILVRVPAFEAWLLAFRAGGRRLWLMPIPRSLCLELPGDFLRAAADTVAPLRKQQMRETTQLKGQSSRKLHPPWIGHGSWRPEHRIGRAADTISIGAGNGSEEIVISVDRVDFIHIRTVQGVEGIHGKGQARAVGDLETPAEA